MCAGHDISCPHEDTTSRASMLCESLGGFRDGGARRTEAAEEARQGRNGTKALAAFGELDEELLHVEAMAVSKMSEAASFMETNVFAVRHQDARSEERRVGKECR